MGYALLANWQRNLLESFRHDSGLISWYTASRSKELDSWSSALPVVFPQNYLDDEMARILCGLRLEVLLCIPHRCKHCGTLRIHIGFMGKNLSRSFSEGQLCTQGSLNDIIHRTLNSAQYALVLEPRGLLRETEKRRDERTRISWKMAGF